MRQQSHKVPCGFCGKPVQALIGAVNVSVCNPCRRAHPKLGPPRPKSVRWSALECQLCGVVFDSVQHHAPRFCSNKCWGIAQRVPGYDDFERKQARAERDRRVGGLSEAKRRRLLGVWRAQGRTCTYCGGPGETVDHVVPLGRGGDNYEGNLAPACRACNSAKKDRLLIEWRTGRQASSTFTRPRYRPKKNARKIGAVRGTQEILQVCGICQGSPLRRPGAQDVRRRALPPRVGQPGRPRSVSRQPGASGRSDRADDLLAAAPRAA